MQIDMINNYIERGPDTETSYVYIINDTPHQGPVSFYSAGNRSPVRTDLVSQPESLNVTIWNMNTTIRTEPNLSTPGVTVTATSAVFDDVLNDVGATKPSSDRRVIADARNGTGTWLDDPSSVGGWPVLERGTTPIDTDHDGMPDDWEATQGLDPADRRDGSEISPNGYTNLENYLNHLAGDPVPLLATP
jgi:hypothetical protein